MSYHVQCQFFISGLNTDQIEVSRKLFSDNPKATEYRVRVSSQVGGGPEGFSDTYFSLNTGPTGGTCSITPADGYVGGPRRTIDCQAWFDKDGIQRYEYYGMEDFFSL